ncbi:MAG: B-box zinc finger protein [Halobacteriales archaeon]
MSAEIKTVDRRLTCDTHGDTEAKQVCGECGTPICDECAKNIHDATFTHFESSGIRNLAVALLLVLGAPILFYVVAPGLLPGLRRQLLPGQVIRLNPAVTLSAVVLGASLLPAIWYRSGDESLDIDLLVRRGNERTVCSDCHETKRAQRGYQYIVTGMAALVGLAGAYLVVTGSYTLLPIVALGVGIYLASDEAVIMLSEALE